MPFSNALIDGLRACEPSAQHTFWASSWAEVYTICVSILGAGPDANDTAVDVLTDFIFKYVQNLSDSRAAHAYIRLMSVRRSLRRRARLKELYEHRYEEIPDTKTVCADEAAEKALLLPRLRECLSQLTPKAQQVLKLRFGEELKNEQIGSLLGGSKQYLGRLIRRSLELLRKCLEAGSAKIRQNSEIPEG